jgi:hypothetical protein
MLAPMFSPGTGRVPCTSSVSTACCITYTCRWRIGYSIDFPHTIGVLERSATESVGYAKTRRKLGTLQCDVRLHSLLQPLTRHFHPGPEPEYRRDGHAVREVAVCHGDRGLAGHSTTPFPLHRKHCSTDALPSSLF